MDKIFSLTCDPMCGFMLKSHDKEEVAKLAKMHTDLKHPEKKITMDQIRQMIKSE